MRRKKERRRSKEDRELGKKLNRLRENGRKVKKKNTNLKQLRQKR